MGLAVASWWGWFAPVTANRYIGTWNKKTMDLHEIIVFRDSDLLFQKPGLLYLKKKQVFQSTAHWGTKGK